MFVQITLDMIDPSLVPLPPMEMHESVLGSSVPVGKTVGSRWPSKRDGKGTGKARADENDPLGVQKQKWTLVKKDPLKPRKAKSRKQPGDDDSDNEDGSNCPGPPRKKGCVKGVANYNADKINVLLDLTEEVLPTGGKGWTVIGDHHRKFKQLVKTTKPTGNAECPPDVERAHYIDSLINEKVHTRDFGDSDLTDHLADYTDSNDSDDSGVQQLRHKKALAKVQPVAHAIKVEQPLPAASCLRARPTAALDALTRITSSLDPSIIAYCEEEHASRSFQMTHIMTLLAHIRNLNAAQLDLHNQLNESQHRLHEANRQADQAEQQLEMTRMFARFSHTQPPMAPTPPCRNPASKDHYKVRYWDGGQATFFATIRFDTSASTSATYSVPVFQAASMHSNMASRPPSPSLDTSAIEVVLTPHRRGAAAVLAKSPMNQLSDDSDDNAISGWGPMQRE
ncbi:hypothetical protein BV25DRAFT_1915188 [Artomyces pyxidatus]|uniref:Uncharacterized protein n=1 Tax=Artomyces pyxidatus TaxID=48021 RepID=A0ACB8T6W3_9AGAM|nr:hypothetical protein BV25DRAFT_1915188 [Artomyces pyxidatus]